jgi:hypothetical protein
MRAANYQSATVLRQLGNSHKKDRESAEEYTQSLGQIGSGFWRQVAWADKQGIPAALGLTVEQWVKQKLGAYIRLGIAERRDAVTELLDDGISQRRIAEYLGVHESTIGRDLAKASAAETVCDSVEDVKFADARGSCAPWRRVIEIAGL